MSKTPTDSQWTDLITRVKGKQAALTFDSAPTSGSSNPVTSGGVYTAISNKATGTTETYTVASSSWSALTDGTPYTHYATVTATYSIGGNTVVHLLNNQAILFGTHGFAVGSVVGQVVTIYSIGAPDSSVTLKINYKESA